MGSDYNKAYWQQIKADPAKLARYRARRTKNQSRRRAFAQKRSALEELILGKLQELPVPEQESTGT